jgi:hypothetical protein
MAVCDRHGETVGILPLTRMLHRYGPLTVRRLAFVGDHRAYRNHLDLLARPGDHATVLSAILAHLSKQTDWDVLDLEALVYDSPSEAVCWQRDGSGASKSILHRTLRCRRAGKSSNTAS